MLDFEVTLADNIYTAKVHFSKEISSPSFSWSFEKTSVWDNNPKREGDFYISRILYPSEDNGKVVFNSSNETLCFNSFNVKKSTYISYSNSELKVKILGPSKYYVLLKNIESGETVDKVFLDFMDGVSTGIVKLISNYNCHYVQTYREPQIFETNIFLDEMSSSRIERVIFRRNTLSIEGFNREYSFLNINWGDSNWDNINLESGSFKKEVKHLYNTRKDLLIQVSMINNFNYKISAIKRLVSSAEI